MSTFNRVRTTLDEFPNVRDNNLVHSVNGPTPSSPVFGTRFVLYDTISDVVMPRAKRIRYPPKPVSHTRIVNRTHAVSTPYIVTTQPDGSAYFTVTVNQPLIVSPTVNVVVDNFPAISSSLWSDLAYEAFDAFYMQVPTEVSIANFSWELRELAQLVPKLYASATRTLAGAYLSDEFGWAPFLSDLNALASLLTTVEGRLNFLRQTWGKRTRLGFSRPNILQIPAIRDEVVFLSPDERCLLWLSSYRADFRAVGYLTHRLEHLDDWIGEARAITAALGLNNPFKAFWDAIPFSFLVGWVSRFGGLLESLAAQPFTGQGQVSEVTCSVKEHGTFDVIFEPGYTGNYPSREVVGEISVDRYTRVTGLPIEALSFNLNDLSPSKLALFMAMLVA